MAKATFDLEENIASLLCYALMWLTGIIFYLVEKENKTIRFHALQSFITFLPLQIIASILGFIGAPSVNYGYLGNPYTYSYNPGIPALVWASWAIYGLSFILWAILMFKAYNGEKLKLPVVGDIAEKHA